MVTVLMFQVNHCEWYEIGVQFYCSACVFFSFPIKLSTFCNLLKCCFIFRLWQVLVVCVGFLWLSGAGAAPRGVWASRRSGFSRCGAQTSGSGASAVAALELSSRSSQAQLLRGMSGHLGPGINPVSLALKSGFLTTGPPGKPQVYLFLNKMPKLTEEYRKPYVKRHYNK